MHQENRFGKLIVFMSACYGGSMFVNYDTHMNVMAFTGENATQYGWRCYEDKEREVYLSDYWSATWKREINNHRDLNKYTFAKLFEDVVDVMSKCPKDASSEPSKYADQSLLELPVSQFLGRKIAKESHNIPSPVEDDLVNTIDAPLVLAKLRIDKATDPIKKAELEKEYQNLVDGRAFIDNHMSRLADEFKRQLYLYSNLAVEKALLTNPACYDALLEEFNENCFSIPHHLFVRTKLHILVNVCNELKYRERYSLTTARNVMTNYCTTHIRGHEFAKIV
jgi:hypothetical protein